MVQRHLEIIPDSVGHTCVGGDAMSETEIKLGDVTYQLSRVFIGSRTVTELLTDHMVGRTWEDVDVDVTKIPAV